MDKEQGEVCDVDVRAQEEGQPEAPMSEGATDPEESSKAIVLTDANSTDTAVDDFRPVVEAKSEKIPKYLYKECLKNHDASIGGHAVDGCGEFMPGVEGTVTELKCAACNCHRNFHRREMETEPSSCNCHHKRKEKKASPEVALHYTPVALPSTPDDHDGGISATAAAMKKRFRTKFSVEQKERMCTLADKLGWKIQKTEEATVQAFCAEIGVKRHVFKVWMHNNKHSLGRKIQV